MIAVGVDPGKEGALCALGPSGVLGIARMPILSAPVRGGRKRGRNEYDLIAIREWLEDLEYDEIFVTVEKSQPMPPSMPGGALANFQRGVMRGWCWMLTAMRIPYELVAPQTWQKVMLAGTPAGDTKQRALIAAQRLFPDVDLRASERSRKPHEGIVDALLIASYGQRRRTE